MPLVIEKRIGNAFESVIVQDLVENHFDPNWHFHPHYQLFTVIEGSGTRFIGDNIQHYDAGDTVFLGPNLPHLWRSDKAYFEQSNLKTRGIVLYFKEDFLGTEFFEISEMIKIKSLLQNSKRGLKWDTASSEIIVNALQKMLRTSGFERILLLLDLLNTLSNLEDYEFITKSGYNNSYKVSETERMQKVYDYVNKNFKEEIKLAQIAQLVNMSESAFCRYFKKRTNSTFIDFVNEIRIGNACKMLAQSNPVITDICFESGFNTLSNFSIQFKKITNCTPSDYLKQIRN